VLRHLTRGRPGVLMSEDVLDKGRDDLSLTMLYLRIDELVSDTFSPQSSYIYILLNNQ